MAQVLRIATPVPITHNVSMGQPIQPTDGLPKREVRDYLREWNLTLDEMNEIIAENPPVLSTLSGFVAEYKLKKLYLQDPRITNLMRPRSHDRKVKGDFRFQYGQRTFTLEVKSLDVPKVRVEGAGFRGTFQCNASDSRPVRLPNGDELTTNCRVVGEFDILAVALFAFDRKWNFAFAHNSDLPRSTWSKYTPTQRQFLLKSSMSITWPLEAPFQGDLFTVLDSILWKRRG
jgi:hypothetical protein